MNFAYTACGDGRKSGLIQWRFVATNHRPINSATVTRLVTTLLPWPGTPNVSPGFAGFLASMRGRRPGVRGGFIGVSDSSEACWPCARACARFELNMCHLGFGAVHFLVAVNDAEHAFAHFDEVGTRLDGARVARFQ